MTSQPVTTNQMQSLDSALGRFCTVVKDAGGNKGRGLFATSVIERGSIIDDSHVLIFQAEEWEKYGKHTVLQHYTFRWRDGQYALALGLGSLFNHTKDPNVGWMRHYDDNFIRFTALRDIEEGEELLICYGSSSLVKSWLQLDDEDDDNDSENDDKEFLSRIE